MNGLVELLDIVEECLFIWLSSPNFSLHSILNVVMSVELVFRLLRDSYAFVKDISTLLNFIDCW